MSKLVPFSPLQRQNKVKKQPVIVEHLLNFQLNDLCMYLIMLSVVEFGEQTDSLCPALFLVIMASWTLKQSCVCTQGCRDFTDYTSSKVCRKLLSPLGETSAQAGQFQRASVWVLWRFSHVQLYASL